LPVHSISVIDTGPRQFPIQGKGPIKVFTLKECWYLSENLRK